MLVIRIYNIIEQVFVCLSGPFDKMNATTGIASVIPGKVRERIDIGSLATSYAKSKKKVL